MPRRGSAGDAERLQAIHELEEAMREAQPKVNAARAERDRAKGVEGDCRRQLAAAEKQIELLRTQVHHRESGVYLNGGESLDRGTVILGNEAIRFAGWHGKIEFPLENVAEVDLGHSHLSPRTGVPVLGRMWPGQARARDSLLLMLGGSGGGQRQLAVIADLRDGEAWREEIREGIERLAANEARRRHLEGERAERQRDLEQAEQQLALAEGRLGDVQRKMGELQSQRDKIRALQRQVELEREAAARGANSRSKGRGRR